MGALGMEFQVVRPTHQVLLSTEPSHQLNNSNKKSLTLYTESFIKNLQSRLAQIAIGIQCIHSKQMSEVLHVDDTKLTGLHILGICRLLCKGLFPMWPSTLLQSQNF